MNTKTEVLLAQTKIPMPPISSYVKIVFALLITVMKGLVQVILPNIFPSTEKGKNDKFQLKEIGNRNNDERQASTKGKKLYNG